MHILESYSLNCGSKIDKPFIYKNYFPLPLEKYIVFTNQNKVQSKDYSYWQDVINFIFPVLEKNGIKIIQLGQRDSFYYDRVVNLCGQVSINQAAYIIERSMLFVGPDGFECQVAGAEGIPVVSINSCSYAANTGPYFGNKSKKISFESYLSNNNKKPSFNLQENPKTVNTIKPESIARAIFSLLDLKDKVPLNTIFTGAKYSHNTIQESIPNNQGLLFNVDHPVEIRADYDCDPESLAIQLSNYKKSVLVMDKPLDINMLKHFKPNIAMTVLKIKDNENRSFVSKLIESGMKPVLISELPQEEINKLKINYYDCDNINKIQNVPQNKVDELKKSIDKLYYRSCKITGAKDRLHYSIAAYENGVVMKNHYEYQKVIDCKSFWDNLDFFSIVEAV